jgi:hypothetical protein
MQSPESNGIAEAFLKTFKRGYVRVHPSTHCLMAATVPPADRQVIDDQDESHPHRGLETISLREYIELVH